MTHWFANDEQPWNIVNISRSECKFCGKNIKYDLGDNNKLYDGDTILNKETVKDCDILINNAALNISGNFNDLSMEQIDRMIQLNFVIPVMMVHDILNRFEDKKIIFVFIASLSNYVYYPYSSVYGSTKIGLTNFARSLGIELFSKEKYNGSDVYCLSRTYRH